MITADPAQDSRTGIYDDGLEPCTQCEQRFDPADMCDTPANEDLCKGCAEQEMTCSDCGNSSPADEVEPFWGICDGCRDYYAHP
ncbi:hypothetical protein [Galactobacter sp.]|uniref:hypothetical protein n=1 Tax=Galactobacter sp. TaxID=2676125 RepID=UPI0025C16562|nr:hypothetical protein [Galactobacter sp.]